jgi:hypothetical protein
MRPYVIVSPSWCVSAGVRVMHMLCHELRQIGVEAWLLITNNLSGDGPVVNPGFTTPLLNGLMDARWPDLKERCILVYPDSVRGNPLGARYVARYILGKELVPPEPSEDFNFYFSKAFPAVKRGDQRVLQIVPIDLSLFNSIDAPERDQNLLWIGKGGRHVGADCPAVKPITYQWPPTRAELATELRRTHLLYSYDAVTALNAEAILCGAVVVLKSLHYHGWTWGREDIAASEYGAGGFAFEDTPAEIERAKLSQASFAANVREQAVNFRPQLWAFVEASQRRFRAVASA